MQSKWMAFSMTIWGSIVLVLPGLFAAVKELTGVDLGDVGQLDEAVKGLLFFVDQIIGWVLVVYGRLRAKSQVTLLP